MKEIKGFYKFNFEETNEKDSDVMVVAVYDDDNTLLNEKWIILDKN